MQQLKTLGRTHHTSTVNSNPRMSFAPSLVRQQVVEAQMNEDTSVIAQTRRKPQ